MSGVSLRTSYTASTRVALSNNMQEASRAAIAMSTGNAITHAYEDPTGLAIGSNMKANYDVLSIVATGIEQSQSMLYIAEDGLKAAYNIVTQMNQVLARAKLGYMTDDLIQKTLSPTYRQLKAEINRIADDIEFNGQKLLNGSGGTQNAATVSTVATTPTYDFSDSSVSLADIGLTATGTLNTTGTISSITNPSSITVDGGAITYDSTNGTTVTGATIVISGATITDSTGNTCIATVTLTGVDLSTTTTPASGAINDALTIDMTNATSSVNITNSSGGITSITTFSATAATNVASTIDNIYTYYPLTGGVGATSEFQFVTGADLTASIVKVDFPNIRLTNSNSGIQGIISTLNTQYNINSNDPSDLTELTGSADADLDIPIVQALADELITQLDNIGAYQQRFMNISSQLSTAVEQIDLAQGAILNTDLSKQIENFTRASVETNVSIAMLKNLNALLQSLQNLVV